MAEIFGTDGIRGGYGSEHINPEAFYDLGATFACQFPAGSEVVIGHDSRKTSPLLAQAVAGGVITAACRPVLMNLAPTPAVAKLSEYFGAGIAVTASHNPEQDNGFKPFLNGDKLSDEQIKEFEERYIELQSQNRERDLLRHETGGKPEVLRSYYFALCSAFPKDALAGKRVLLDCANGAMSTIAPRFFTDHLGARTATIATYTDAPINDGFGAADLRGLKRFITTRVPDDFHEGEFLGGFSFDGDGDRVMGVSLKGREINGNHWLHRLADGQEGIVGTLYTNNALRRNLQARGIAFHECSNGDANVTRKLRELDLQRGGEFTGHLIDLNHLSSGDGLYMAAYLAIQLAQEGETLDDVHERLPLWPEEMKNMHISPDKLSSLSDEIIEDVIDQQLGNRANTHVVVRRSGTEPLLRMWVQAQTRQDVNEAIGKLERGFHYL